MASLPAQAAAAATPAKTLQVQHPVLAPRPSSHLPTVRRVGPVIAAQATAKTRALAMTSLDTPLQVVMLQIQDTLPQTAALLPKFSVLPVLMPSVAEQHGAPSVPVDRIVLAARPRRAAPPLARCPPKVIHSVQPYQMATKSLQEPARTRLHSLRVSLESTEPQPVELARHALSARSVMRHQHQAAAPVHTRRLAGQAVPPFLMAVSKAPRQGDSLLALAQMSTTTLRLVNARATAHPTPSATLLLVPSQSASWVST